MLVDYGDSWICLTLYSVTAIADKLGIEFALIHRQRDGKSENAPDRMDILVGDVKDKVRYPSLTFHLSRPASSLTLILDSGCYPC